MAENIRTYILRRAAEEGFDPDVVMAIVMGEGGVTDPTNRSRGYDASIGGREQSIGPFQLNMRGGLGQKLLEERNIDVRDPANVYKGIDYALERAKVEGWTPWLNTMNKLGYNKWTGINDRGAAEPGGRYDPRRDSPSYARPTGADVAGYADEHPVGPEGDVVTRSPYDLPAPGTADNPLITREATKNPFEKVGAAVAKLGDRSKESTLGGIQNVPNPPLTSMPAISSIDPQSANNQRNALVAALMRVNSGQLWPMGGGGGGGMGGGGFG